ncbi:MAG: hypothetical protein ACSHX0_09005 [Akkermansiaceae bacterium]
MSLLTVLINLLKKGKKGLVSSYLICILRAPSAALRVKKRLVRKKKAASEQLNYRVAPEKKPYCGHLIYHNGLLGTLVVFHVLPALDFFCSRTSFPSITPLPAINFKDLNKVFHYLTKKTQEYAYH